MSLTKEIELKTTCDMTTQLPLLVPEITSWRACQLFGVQTVNGAIRYQVAKVSGAHFDDLLKIIFTFFVKNLSEALGNKFIPRAAV